MTSIPTERTLDATLALLRDGYSFIPKRARAFGSDLFATRLMLTRAVCMTGPDAARAFYRPGAVTRKGGMPQLSFTLIQDNCSVMTLEGAAHRRRKAMFVALFAPDAVARLTDAFARHWRAQLPVWAGRSDISVFDEAHLVLTRAACEWAGLTLTDADAKRRADEFRAMVEGTGSVGTRNVRGHLLRARTERWARGVVGAVREGRTDAPEGSAVRVVADHRDEDGRPLDLKVAGVELINALRPTVANARYFAFAAHALHLNPQAREALTSGDRAARLRFADEVRRFYPFIPFIGGIVREPFELGGHALREGDWTLMDLYGTNRDPRVWTEPDRFDPERFAAEPRDRDGFVSHGAGDPRVTHRCPGEGLTVALIDRCADLLARETRYDVPPQDLSIPLNRLPALPRDRMAIRNVRAA